MAHLAQREQSDFRLLKGGFLVLLSSGKPCLLVIQETRSAHGARETKTEPYHQGL